MAGMSSSSVQDNYYLRPNSGVRFSNAGVSPGQSRRLRKDEVPPKAPDPHSMYMNPLNPKEWYDYWIDEHGQKHYGPRPMNTRDRINLAYYNATP